MQSMLGKICELSGIDVEIYGCYLGLNEQSKKMNIKGEGYWFDDLNKGTVDDPALMFQGLLELLFSAPHGTCKGYYKSGDKVTPIFGHYEYGENSKMKFITDQIRQGALSLVRDIFANSFKINITSDEAMRKLKEVGMTPTNGDVELLGDVLFEDGALNPLAAPKQLRKYVESPNRLKIDLLNSRWKVGFLKRMLRVRLPYDSLFYWVKSNSGDK